jgi:hypothetical protein
VRTDKLKIGQAGGPNYVKLENGTLLIPQTNYDAIRKTLSP